jgi:hypothetical protein
VSGGGTTPPGSIIEAVAAPIVTVTNITGVLQVGQALTGVYGFNANGGNAIDASTMQWLNGGHTDTDTSYLLAADDVGKVLTFEVTAKNGLNVPGNKDSMTTATALGVSGGGTTPPGSIIDAAAAPIVSVTNITGTLQVGQTLTGVYGFNANGGNAIDASTMQWLNGGHNDTDTSYLLAADDVGKVLTFEVTAKNGLNVSGNKDSMTTANATGVSGGGGGGSIIDPAAPATVTISGEVGGYPQVGAPLTAAVTCVSTCAPLTYEWLIESAIGSGNYQPIGGATASTYTPVGGDQLRKVKVRASK